MAAAQGFTEASLHLSEWRLSIDWDVSVVLFAAVGVGVWLFMLFIGTSAILTSYLRYNFKPTPISSSLPKHKAPGVSILRPLKGDDANLRDNLASSFRLKYPNFQILFSVADADDPAIQVVKELAKEYPHVDSQLFVGESHLGVNPKVNNMLTAYTLAKHNIIWILDSNITASPHTLGRAVDCLTQPNVGLVHHIPIGVRPETFGTAVEQVFLNACHAKLYTMINKLRMGSCVIGKSNMFRKSDLEFVGGLAYFGKFMSEDNIIGQSIWKVGKRHVIPGDVVYQPLGSGGLKDYFKRRARWTRIRKFTVLGATIVEPFMECVLNGVLGAFGFWVFFGVPRLWFFGWHLCYWLLVDIMFGLAVDSGMVLDNFPRFIAAWTLREVTALPVYLYACAGSRVEWRGRPFKLKPDGTVEPDTFDEDWRRQQRHAFNHESAMGKLSWTLCSPDITLRVKLWLILASGFSFLLFYGAVALESVRCAVGFGDPHTSGVGRVDSTVTLIPSTSPPLSQARVIVGHNIGCEGPVKFNSVASNKDNAIHSFDELPTLPRKKAQTTSVNLILHTPLWEMTAAYVSGCHFVIPPTIGEAWTAVISSLTERARNTHAKSQ
ncbi:glycosyl transferase family 21-domain-containing protein [Chytriomyces sp. MP71]|nr:glycosyl transferase family 21-domain-containing protein [Chytriomyces sp. MP71]